MNDTTNYCPNCERLSEENAQLREALEEAQVTIEGLLDYGEVGLSLVRKARRTLHARAG